MEVRVVSRPTNYTAVCSSSTTNQSFFFFFFFPSSSYYYIVDMVLTDEQLHDLDLTYNTLGWNIIQGKLEGEQKRPAILNYRDYFDSKQTVPYEVLVEYMKQANKLDCILLY
jgi:hypothetical protein